MIITLYLFNGCHCDLIGCRYILQECTGLLLGDHTRCCGLTLLKVLFFDNSDHLSRAEFSSTFQLGLLLDGPEQLVRAQAHRQTTTARANWLALLCDGNVGQPQLQLGGQLRAESAVGRAD